MKILKIVGILFGVYVGIVVLFESLLGYFQPAGDTTILIATTDEDGNRSERVLSRLDSEEQLYVAANHWPRAWFHEVLEHPEVQVTVGDVTGDYLAVPVSPEEHDRLNSEHPLGPVIRVLTGFPPRYFVRLDPRSPGAG